MVVSMVIVSVLSRTESAVRVLEGETIGSVFEL